MMYFVIEIELTGRTWTIIDLLRISVVYPTWVDV